MTDPIRAPWTPEQVAALNAFQQRGGMHPFTCGGDHTPGSPKLVAREDGWHCPQPYGEPCDYRQDWAHPFMADPDTWPKWPFGERHGPTPEEVQAAVSNARAHNASLAIPPRAEVNRYARLGPEAQALVDDYDVLDLAEFLVKAHDDLERARRDLADRDAADSADAAAGSYAGRAEELEAAIAHVRRLHLPIAGEAGTRWCNTCSQEERQAPPVGWWVPYPCPTVTALDPVAPAIAQPEPWLHVAFTIPDRVTANTSALAIADHLAAEFPGVSMRITTNATEVGVSLTPAEAARLAQSGIDTPGCDCGHDGMGESWHGDTCDWKSIPPCDVCGVRGHSFEDCDESTAPELTAEEARDLADELGTELYKTQDALAFVEECCVIADREQRAITTADVRKWLKGAQCGRQLAADGLVIDPAAPPLEFVTWTGPVVPRFTYRPVTPEMERAATERAEQCAEQGERTAAWFAATGGVLGATDCSPGAEETEPNNPPATEATGLRTRVTALFEQWVKAGPPPLGVQTARWWDRRLAELRAAIHGPAEQPRTTPNNPAGT